MRTAFEMQLLSKWATRKLWATGSLWFNEIANVLIIKLKLQHKFSGKLFASSVQIVWVYVAWSSLVLTWKSSHCNTPYAIVHQFCWIVIVWWNNKTNRRMQLYCERECQDFNHKCYFKIVINLVSVSLSLSLSLSLSTRDLHHICLPFGNPSFSHLGFLQWDFWAFRLCVKIQAHRPNRKQFHRISTDTHTHITPPRICEWAQITKLCRNKMSSFLTCNLNKL